MGRGEPSLLQLVRPAVAEGPERLPDVRPPDGRTPTLNRSSMRAARTASIVITAALVSVGAAGCGGSKVDYQEGPSGPVEVTIPSDPNSLGDAAASGSASATATPSASATPT